MSHDGGCFRLGQCLEEPCLDLVYGLDNTAVYQLCTDKHLGVACLLARDHPQGALEQCLAQLVHRRAIRGIVQNSRPQTAEMMHEPFTGKIDCYERLIHLHQTDQRPTH